MKVVGSDGSTFGGAVLRMPQQIFNLLLMYSLKCK